VPKKCVKYENETKIGKSKAVGQDVEVLTRSEQVSKGPSDYKYLTRSEQVGKGANGSESTAD
jgi:hypothetical protein